MTDLVEVKKEPEDYHSGDEDHQDQLSNSGPISSGSGNGTDHIKKETEMKTERTDDFGKLLDYGLDIKVASRLDEIYLTGKLTHSDLDERALDALKEFPVEGALAVLAQFVESNLEHVSNKSAYLCGVMKTYRQKSRDSGRSGNGGASSSGGSTSGINNGLNGGSSSSSNNLVGRGPDQDKINEILERTGYTLDVTTGQRKYGGPPPAWEGEAPGNGCEVFCGKIPRDLYEDELIPLFEECGEIWDLRLMMDPMTGLNRGYAFVTFTNRESALQAVRKLDGHELERGKNSSSSAIALKVNVSEPKARLFIGNIPKSKGRNEIVDEFEKLSAGLKEVIIYSSPDDKKKNRGFCFLEYESHKAASLAKRRLETGRVKVWSCDIIVDWADPQEEPDADTMSQVKVLYVRNLTVGVTEEKLREVFEIHGKVDRVKKIKDYAFVHFEERDQADAAMRALNGKDVGGAELQISLAKPPSDKKKKEEMLRKREQRMMKTMGPHGMALPPFPPFPPAFGPMGPHGVAAVNAMYRAAHPGLGGMGPRGGLNMRGGFQRGYDNSGYYGAWGWSGDSWAHGGHPHHQPQPHPGASGHAHHHHHNNNPHSHAGHRGSTSSNNGSSNNWNSNGEGNNNWNNSNGGNTRNNNWNGTEQQNGYFNGTSQRNPSSRGKLKT